MNGMFGRQVLAVLVMSLTAIVSPAAMATLAPDVALRSDLQRIAAQSIYFGHQSVGVNLLEGIRELAVEAGVPIQIAEVNSASDIRQPMLGHRFVGENGNPIGKLKSFEQAIGYSKNSLNLVMVKFCYVDFTPDTDVKAVFSSYRSTMDSIKAKNPGMTIIHITTPLTDVQVGPKAFIKRLLGRAPYGVLENMRRHEYNTLLRQAYQSREPIFDLAQLESTAPDGTASTAEWNGTKFPKLTAAYTDDGGHLNSQGRLRASRELVAILASYRQKN
jgi:hypothetical protein